MQYLLQFRFKQAYRALREVGVLLLLLVSPLLLIFVLSLLEMVQQTGAPLIGLLGLYAVFTIHARRQDGGFLRLLNFSSWKVYLMEYTVAAIPLSLLSVIVLLDFLNPLLLHIGAALIAFLPSGFSSYFQTSGGAALNWVPNQYYEYKTALRKDFKWVVLLYLIGIATSVYAVSMPVVILLLLLISAAAFDPIENKEILEKTVLQKNWLFSKTLKQLKAFHLSMLPIYALYLFFHYEYWIILLAVSIVGTALITFAVSYKYAHYYPGRKSANNKMPISIFILFLMVPFLAPANIVYLIVYYRRAKRNMTLYYQSL
ncbi:MAG: hypothetical protein AB8F74_02500 [Saprospiraceae bacterium]